VNSLQLAVLLTAILVIAFAAGAYIYTTASSAPQWAQPIIIKGVCVHSNGTVAVHVSMIGSGCVRIVKVEVGGMSASMDATLCAGQQGIVKAELQAAVLTLAEGRLVMDDGRAVPFVASVC